MPFSTPIIIAGLLSALLAIVAWQRHNVPGAPPLAALMAAVAFWSLGYGIELSSSGDPNGGRDARPCENPNNRHASMTGTGFHLPPISE